MRGQVYVKTARGQVLTGTFQFFSSNLFPNWLEPPYRAENDEERVYVRMIDGHGLIGNLVPLHNNVPNEYFRGNHCFIQLPNNIILHSILRPYTNYAVNIPRNTRVSIRIPGEPLTIYAGALEPLGSHHPSWLPQQM